VNLGLSLAMGGRAQSSFSPVSLGGVVLWLRADLGVTVNGSNEVTAWADQSGLGDSGRIWTPPGTDKPAWNATDASYNNQATIGTFNKAGVAGDCRLRSGTWSATYTTPFVVIIGHTAAAGSRYFSYEGGTDYLALLNAGASGARVYSSDSSSSLSSGAGILLSSAPALVAAYYNGASSELYANSLTSTTATGTLVAPSLGNAPLFLGSFAGSATSYGVERIAQVIIFSSKPSAGALTTLRDHLNSFYGASFT